MIPAEALKNRLITLLVSRKGEFAPANPELDKFDHSLQCATRAWKAGEPPDYVVMALFHDVFGGFHSHRHGEMVETVLWRWLSQRAREAVRYHEESTSEVRIIGVGGINLRPGAPESLVFAAAYDYPSFDPNYESYVLARFYPLIDEVIHD